MLKYTNFYIIFSILQFSFELLAQLYIPYLCKYYVGTDSTLITFANNYNTYQLCL